MTSSLISIVYVSSATRAFQADRDLADILRSSRRNNARLGVTGMLLYRDGNFIQVLEGMDKDVLQLMDWVRSDPRHSGIIILLNKKIAARSFEEWSMGFRDLSNIGPEDQQALSPFLTTSLLDKQFQDNPENCFKLLLSFKSSIR